MQNTAALQGLAGYAATIATEALEGILSTFDTVVNMSGPDARPEAAGILRKAAESCESGSRRARLVQAAEDVEAGRPCARAVEDLSALPQAVIIPGEEDAERDEGSSFLLDAPPPMPHLSVPHFFPGLTVRVARDFADANGNAVRATDLLTLIACTHEAGEHVLNCLDRNIHLNAGQAEIAVNANNAWFQPVPSVECLSDLVTEIELLLAEAEEDPDADLDDIEALRDDVERCQAWISKQYRQGKAPRCRSLRLVSEIFDPSDPLFSLIPSLFAGAAAI